MYYNTAIFWSARVHNFGFCGDVVGKELLQKTEDNKCWMELYFGMKYITGWVDINHVHLI